nr:phosphotransferase [Corynebacterium lactis]
MSIPTADLIATELAQSLPKMRFFADKTSTIESVEVLSLEPVVRADAASPDIDIALVRVHTASASPTYQLPIAWASELPQGLDQAVLVKAEGLLGYDALADAAAVTALGIKLAEGGSLGAMELKTVPGAELPRPTAGRPMGVEQSNTSVIFDDAVMCKFFRRLHPGTNADVELLAALSQAGCDSVPRLFGWLEATIGGETYTTAMMQEFVPNSVDGWELALGAVRDAIREIDLDLDQLGTDFALESRALGEAVAAVHHSLAAALPVKNRLSGSELVAPLRARLEFVAGVVPEIAEVRAKAEAVFARAEEAVPAEGAVVQRIHGDLHLGQVLRTPRGWRLIDFEGEPSRPWEERRLPDHPLRDVAGMLRSFDYAAHYPLLTGREDAEATTSRVDQWARRNIEAFLDGYADAGSAELLDAFVLDKAIYECLYEAQNRPDWLALPLGAVRTLLG